MRKSTLLFFLVLFMLSQKVVAQSNFNPSAVIEHAAAHTSAMVAQMDTAKKILSPRTLTSDRTRTQYVPLEEWTSGFFPGTLWYLYELTGDEKWLAAATKYTEGMEHIKHYTGNHDIGFMIFCSFGNGLRLTSNQNYNPIIVTAAQTLMKRYRADAGIIQSWPKQRGWECPVIIDNMMNLELLFEATRISGDSSFWHAAVSHADNTIKHQYRQDNSCYHVVDYDPSNGSVRGKYTAQGYADESAWARGQAWGLYGYILCYRYTGDKKYLNHAEKIAQFIFNHPRLPKDLIPYWDYDAVAPANQGTYADRLGLTNPRDVSSATVTASALYELSTMVNGGGVYARLADKILKNLNTPLYTAQLGSNGNFILKHSTGSIPHNTEIDVPLVYADYYYLEAIKRKLDLEKSKKSKK